MSFTYNFGANGAPDQVRALIADTNPAQPIFQDSEIAMFLAMESSSFLYVSGMASQTGSVGPPPVNVTSVLRAAALALDSMASNKAFLASIQELLDVKLSAKDAAAALHAQAKNYRDTEANAGHFAIAEMCNDQFQARERVWKQLLRLTGGA